MKKIAILDLNIGNLNSIYNALDKVNGNTIITSEIKLIKDSDLIIIPGNGSFKEAMKNLKINKTDDFLREIFLEKKKKSYGNLYRYANFFKF